MPSEVLVGVLHPALARVGQLWESGEITIADVIATRRPGLVGLSVSLAESIPASLAPG